MTQTQQQNKIELQPLSNRVLVKRLDAQESMKGGIIIPDSAKKKQETAEVVAVGPGKKDKNGQTLAMPIQKGDKVLIDKYSGQEVTLNDQEYVIVRSDDIIAVIK